MAGLVNNISESWQASTLQAMVDALPFPQHVKDWQNKALHCFLEDGYPTRRLESWRYCDMNALLAQSFYADSAAPVSDVSHFFIEGTDRLVFVNGMLDLEHSFWSDRFIVTPLNIMLSTADEALLKRFDIHLKAPYFAGLNSALMKDGAHIKINNTQQSHRPLHILSVGASLSSPAMMQTRIFIDMESYAECTVIEEYVGMGGTYFNNVVTQIELSEHAILYHYKLQREAEKAYHVANTLVAQRKHSQFHYGHFSKGGVLSRDDLYIRHEESDSQAYLRGLLAARCHQKIMHAMRADHYGKRTTTHQHVRGIVDDHAQGIFNGHLLVHPGAEKSELVQSNHNLLLSQESEIDTKPVLEIYVDDVSASHGATVGQLDTEALFYLQSRGIALEQAKRLLTQAFAEAIFDSLPENAVIAYLKKVVLENLT